VVCFKIAANDSSFARPVTTISMKDGRETGFLEEYGSGELCVLKGAGTVRKGPERKGLSTVPRSQATLL
jgi:hypothetical protein